MFPVKLQTICYDRDEVLNVGDYGSGCETSSVKQLVDYEFIGVDGVEEHRSYSTVLKNSERRGHVAGRYRVQHGSGEQISLLGFGMMRLPNNQEEVNKLVDYAIEHGVNYFDTAPMYMGGQSEVLMGNALSRHPRNKYFVATKMSNMSQNQWSLEASKRMYEQSRQKLKVDVIDYYLLHGIGGGMNTLKGRFLDNGVLDFLLEERKAGRIKHLGFSYHGDVSDFDWLLDHQEEYHWDFVQIQMNFLDWRHASMRGGRRSDADAEYLYNKCDKLGIQCVVMEPLRGGTFGHMAQEITDRLKAVHPDDSSARWAFRWVGSHTNILTTLSGMNRMDHLEENVKTFSPLDPCTDAENNLLAEIADQMSGFPNIPCITCSYCMPCPFGVDIPTNFATYNDAVTKVLPAMPLPTKPSPMLTRRLSQTRRNGLRHVRTAKSVCRSVHSRFVFRIRWRASWRHYARHSRVS